MGRYDAAVRVLLVDDDDLFAIVLKRLLEAAGAGYRFERAATYDAGQARVLAHEHDVYLVDFHLDGRSGLDLVRAGVAAGVEAPFILLTADTDPVVDESALQAGAADFLPKAKLSTPLLHRSIRYSVRQAKAHGDLLAILDQLEQGTLLTDGAGVVTFANRAAGKLVARVAGELVGQPWRAALPFGPAELEELEAALRAPAAARRPVTVSFRGPDHEVRWAQVDVHDDPRGAPGHIFALRDRSEVHSMRELLEEGGRFRHLVGRSAAMRQVYRQLTDFAPADITVLLLGESGTGKELAARSLHDASARRSRPFLAVNCAGLSESLLASQLFGHRRGAFTGAVEDHRGFFEAAAGGTLFLDEIGDFPANVQASLLRVLQEREILRLGDSAPRKVDVRIIAATHRDLELDIREGRFRLDLYYRLKVATIRMPALRDRRDDVPLLASWFLETSRKKRGGGPAQLSAEALRALAGWPWPGNVRELASLLEVAAIRARGPVLEVGDLGLEAVAPEPPPPPAPVSSPETAVSERDRLLAAIRAASGNRAAAARALGLSRATFYRHLERLGIPVKD